MDLMLNVFLAIVETFLAFGLGALAMRYQFLQPGDLPRLGRLTLDLMFPLMVFSSITRNFDPSRLNDLWLMPVLGFALMAFGALAGLGLRRGMRGRTPARLATFHHFCAVNNYVFLPLIVLDKIWGEHYVSLLLLMNVGSTIGFWTIGVLTLGGSGLSQSIKNIFSINLLAVAAALFVSFLGLPIPTVLANTARSIGDASVPVMLLLIGAAIYNSAGKIFHYKFDVLYLSAVRLVLLPLLIVLALKLLPLPREVYEVTFVVALMPVSSSSVLITQRYGGCTDFAGQAIVVTTVLSLFSIPLMLNLL